MYLDKRHSLNEAVLSHLVENKQRTTVLIAEPDTHSDPYMEAGSHPDIVQRVWDQLGPSLPADCRALIYGGPALVHPESGVIIALAYGTQYGVRIPLERQKEAMDAGCTVEQSWSSGGSTNIRDALGDDWVFGGWATAESQWLCESYAALEVR